MSTPDACSYVYGVACAFDPARIAGLRGVDGADVGLVGHDGIVAVVSAMDPDEADERRLAARLDDLDQLEQLARAHHAVVDTVARHSATVPFRLATVLRGQRRVPDLLRHRYGQFIRALDHVAGRVEMGVKVYAAPAIPAEVGTPREAAVAGSGREYLHQRRRETIRREHSDERIAALVQALDAELGHMAEDRRHHRPQDPRLSGTNRVNLFNAAYLVERRRVEAFVARTRSGVGLDVVVTGPWAPYSFAGLDEETA